MWNFDFDLKFNSSLQFYFRLAFTSFGNLFSTTIQSKKIKPNIN